MKRYQITLDRRTFDVRLLSDPLQEQVDVEVNGERFTVEVRAVPPEGETVTLPPATSTAQPAAVPGSAGRAPAPSTGTLTAPLPGVIKSISVKPGEQVSAGSVLLVIEAMKMDNVIRSPREGVVEEIYIAEGRQVAHGEPLVKFRG
jgi:biotin carboxyl carrier protein